MAERSFATEVQELRLGAGEEFRGEGILAVTKGLQVGDQVVIDGTDRLREGAKIRKPAAGPRSTSGSPVAAAPPGGGGAGRPARSNQ